MKIKVLFRNILKLLAVLGAIIGSNSWFGRNASAVSRPIDTNPQAINTKVGNNSTNGRIVVSHANIETLQNFQDEVACAMGEALNDSKFSELLKKYGLLNKKALKIKCAININQIKNNQNLNIEPQLREALEALSTEEFEVVTCCACSDGFVCCPCSC